LRLPAEPCIVTRRMTERASAAPEVRVLANAEAAVPILLGELRAAIARAGGARPLVSFATGGTFAAFLQALAAELDSGRVPRDAFAATHLDEYVGFPPDRSGGMVHELIARCPPLCDMLRRGMFLPVPHDGSDAALQAHAARLQRAGGVSLQFLGLGRNGHVAFNEPGTPFDSGFHRARLARTTRDDARPRFAPDEPPELAVTAGLATILAARRIVLCAFGRGKADAVRAMLCAPVGEACPASALRRHADALVLLDGAAAGALGGSAAASAADRQ
jgi:glucosamine-6-phosphate deaminase